MQYGAYEVLGYPQVPDMKFVGFDTKVGDTGEVEYPMEKIPFVQCPPLFCCVLLVLPDGVAIEVVVKMIPIAFVTGCCATVAHHIRVEMAKF